jgi:hypothetical protein
MPRVPDLPKHLRFFARLEKFHCECPKCGRVISTFTKRSKSQQPFAVWNPITGRLRCPYCNTQYGTGLLLYPVATRKPGVHEHRPYDWTPTWQQLRELRALSPGRYVIGEAERSGDFRNLVVEAECQCEADQRWECPLHPKGTRGNDED